MLAAQKCAGIFAYTLTVRVIEQIIEPHVLTPNAGLSIGSEWARSGGSESALALIDMCTLYRLLRAEQLGRRWVTAESAARSRRGQRVRFINRVKCR